MGGFGGGSSADVRAGDHGTVSGRMVCLAAVLAVSLVSGDEAPLGTALAVVLVGGAAALVAYATGRNALALLVVETSAVGVVVGVGLPASLPCMPYLLVLSMIAGRLHELPGVLVTTAAQVLGVLMVPLAIGALDGSAPLGVELAPWLATGVGVGLLGVWSRGHGAAWTMDGNDDYYESARQLLTQLRRVTRRLSAGLDSEGMAAALLTTMHERLDDSLGAVFVCQGSLLVPLAYRGPGAQQLLAPNDPLVERCWTTRAAVQGIVPVGGLDERHRVVLPLRVGDRMFGVAVSSSADAASSGTVAALFAELDAHSLRLDTALVFDEIRTMATADERQRLAREIHDGIAQEVASLGYVVDHIAATTADPTVTDSLRKLRSQLSGTVADLRLSIFELRSDTSATNGLGVALADYVRAVGATSGLTVHLTLDEASHRLAPAVEAELLRIAQEAITNARKHASARNLWVDCSTDPPRARLVVRDDGVGLRARRHDSYGISIMRERAERIDATLEVSNGATAAYGRGTVVDVRVAGQRTSTAKAQPRP